VLQELCGEDVLSRASEEFRRSKRGRGR
jgi:hypothetical protein